MRPRFRRLLVAIVVVHLLAARVQTQTAAVDFSAIDRVIAQELTDTHTPGAAESIVSGDRVVFRRLRRREHRDPGTGAARDAVQARIDHQNVHSGGPGAPGGAGRRQSERADWQLRERPAAEDRPADRDQLLTHTSGFLDEAPMFGSDDENALEKEVRSWTANRFFTEPGRIYSYSNPAFWLAGFVVQSVSGKRYADQMAASLFKPLGMSRTTLRPLVR